MPSEHPNRATVIEELQKLGMSGYEAKAYVALISAGGPLSGYEVAKRSRVPRSTVYETLGKLSSRGAAFKVSVDGGAAYLPLPPDSLLAELRGQFEGSIGSMREALPGVVQPSATRIIHHLTSEKAVLDRAGEMLRSARSSLYLALWDSEIQLLQPLISEAKARNVTLFFLAFGEEEGDGPESGEGPVPHRLRVAPNDNAPVDRRLLVIVCDRGTILVGRATDQDMRAIHSDDPAVVLLGIEYVRHDIALQQLAARFGLAETLSMWKSDRELRRLAAKTGVPGEGPEIDD